MKAITETGVVGGRIIWTCDICGQVILEDISITDNEMILCKTCSCRWNQLEKGRLRDSIQRFSIGNVC